MSNNRFEVRVEQEHVVIDIEDADGGHTRTALTGAHAATLAMTIGLCSQTIKGGMLGKDELHRRLHADGATDIIGGVQIG